MAFRLRSSDCGIAGSYFVPVPKFLDKYTYSGHAAIMGKKKNNWQNTDYVLKLFNSKLSLARRRYREYLWKKGWI